MRGCGVVAAVMVVCGLAMGQPAPTTPPTTPPPTPPPATAPTTPPTVPSAPAAAPASPGGAEAAKPAARRAAPTPPGHLGYFETSNARVVAPGYKFTEGPCWVPSEELPHRGFFVFCDVPSDVMYRWDGAEAPPQVFLQPSSKAVGSAVDAKGDLYLAQCGYRQITRVPLKTGVPMPTVPLVAKVGDKRLNATNDLCVAKDGTVYFTDPTFFTPKTELELDYLGVYRLATDGTLTLVTKSLRAPNGIALSLDEKTLYVNDFGATKTMKIELKEDGTFGEPQVFADLLALARDNGVTGTGNADGLRLDDRGNIYTTGPGGVLVINPEGKLVANLNLRGVSNLAFGGENGRIMLITAGSVVLRVQTVHAGATWKPPAAKEAAPAATTDGVKEATKAEPDKK